MDRCEFGRFRTASTSHVLVTGTRASGKSSLLQQVRYRLPEFKVGVHLGPLAPEVLKIESVDVPPPGPGEARVGARALGLNRDESMYRSGVYVVEPSYPAKIGYEIADEVESVGPGVSNVVVGDKVSLLPLSALTDYDVHAELAVVRAELLVNTPPTWVGRSRRCVDAVPDGLRCAHRDSQGRPRRYGRDPGRIKQRRIGRYPARQNAPAR